MQTTPIPAALLLPISLFAQWANVKTPGIPRTPDGKPNLTAPAPRTADGKPDLSGLWSPGFNLYWIDVIQDMKEEAIFKPEAQAVFRKRAVEYNRDAPYTRCLPAGPLDSFSQVSRIIQLPAEVIVLRNDPAGDRRIEMDGRELPIDADPTWRGYSIGRWDADTLVVETSGFNDVGWLDQMGHPRSEKLHVIERFQRVDFGHMQLQITLDDAEMLARPLTLSLALNYLADTDTPESICNENERDRAHFVAGQPKAKITLSAVALAKYVGTYEPGGNIISVVNEQLYFWDIPIFPQSETLFDSRLAPMEFSLDANGEVTGLTLDGAAGDEFTFARKR